MPCMWIWIEINKTAIVILKDVPVLQCQNCSEYLRGDPVMSRVEEILEKADAAAELEIIRYAAWWRYGNKSDEVY